ncbi:retrovirus-related pol polyprotein from transposon TNT 1-94 [Tanacetum coccineum]
MGGKGSRVGSWWCSNESGGLKEAKGEPVQSKPFKRTDYEVDLNSRPDVIGPKTVIRLLLHQKGVQLWFDCITAKMAVIASRLSDESNAFGQLLRSKDFWQITTPNIIAGSSEGGADVFKFKYKKQPACLAQSPQLHKQMAICGLDVEMIIKEHYFKVMDIVDSLFVDMFDKLNETCQKELEAIRKHVRMINWSSLAKQEDNVVAGNSQVKDNKIDLLVQKCEQFVISEDESIDSDFARFNTIITSLKALDEKNYVRKFLRALHPKWGAKVTTIENKEDDEKTKDETCLVAQASNKGVDLESTNCQSPKIDNEILKEEALKLTQFEKSTHCLNEMLSNQKPSGDKLGLGFNSFEASTSGTKKIKFVKSQNETPSGGGPPNTEGDPRKAQMTPKAIKGPPVYSPESEKSVSFQKSILGPRPKHIMVNNAKIPIASDNEVTFSEHDSEITKDGKFTSRGIRKKGLYVMKLRNKPKDKICLPMIDENSTLWHNRLGHANMRLIQWLASKELVRNLPKFKFVQHFCDACKMGKQAHASHKAKNIVSTTRCLELLHMDL